MGVIDVSYRFGATTASIKPYSVTQPKLWKPIKNLGCGVLQYTILKTA